MRTAFIGKADTSKPGVFIYGACKKGIEACEKIKQDKAVLGFLDDDNQHKNKKEHTPLYSVLHPLPACVESRTPLLDVSLNAPAETQ